MHPLLLLTVCLAACGQVLADFTAERNRKELS